MSLAIFDLDNTLLAGDSDYLWGKFLAEQGVVDGDYYERENQRFYDEYRAGTLDILEFLAFSLQPLAQTDRGQLEDLRAQFVTTRIAPIIPRASRALLAEHRAAGRTLIIITATNAFVTEPIAAELGVDALLATEPEERDGRFTGHVAGTPCFREGKVTRLNTWLQRSGETMNDAWFYSDSHNDLPLLEQVANPVAVDPDETLAQHAEYRGWPIVTLRAPSGQPAPWPGATPTP